MGNAGVSKLYIRLAVISSVSTGAEPSLLIPAVPIAHLALPPPATGHRISAKLGSLLSELIRESGYRGKVPPYVIKRATKHSGIAAAG